MESTKTEILEDKKGGEKMNQESSSKSPPILIVDDDKDFLKSIEFILISNKITNVECCQDSSNVMPLLEKKKYSLILLDLKMSPISGLELLPKIVETYPEIPVIVLTADDRIKTVVNCIKYGAFDYLVKPFETTHLLKAVRNSIDFVSLENENNILKEFDFTNKKDSSVYSKSLLKIDFLLRTGKAQIVISKVVPIIENKQINRDNVDLFYSLGKAYEKIEDLEEAVRLYRGIARFDPLYPGIQQKLEDVRNKIKRIDIKVPIK